MELAPKFLRGVWPVEAPGTRPAGTLFCSASVAVRTASAVRVFDAPLDVALAPATPVVPAILEFEGTLRFASGFIPCVVIAGLPLSPGFSVAAFELYAFLLAIVEVAPVGLPIAPRVFDAGLC